MIELRARSAGGVVTVSVFGDVDLAAVDVLVPATIAAVEPGHERLEMDFAGVDFIDSSGLGALVRIRNRLLQDGVEFVLVNCSDRALEVLSLTRLDGVLLGPSGQA